MFSSLLKIVAFLGEIFYAVNAGRPHIIFVMMDDGGYGDVSYHGAEYDTPVIDQLASEGVKLENYYVLAACSPTRASFMTGRHSIEFGIRIPVQNTGHGNGIPLNHPTIPEALKPLGYETHHVGKWHLGGSSWHFTPIGRGFDSEFSFHGGVLEYFTHDRAGAARDPRCDPRPGPSLNWGFDLWNNQQPVGGLYEGRYSTTLFTERAIEIINEHEWISEGEDENPLFIWLSYAAPHSPWQAPNIIQDAYCSHIAFEPRRIYCAMVRAVDIDLQRIMDTLKEKDYFDDTLFILSSDNGASIVRDTTSPAGNLPAAGSNAPYRNGKNNLFEGGNKAYAFVWGNMLDESVRGTENRELFHVSDWYLTLLDAAGGSPATSVTRTTPSGDEISISHNQWDSLRTGSAGPRHTMLYNVGPNELQVAVRNDDYKLYTGTNRVSADGWFSFNASMPDEYICGQPMDGVTPCSQVNPESMFWNIKDDPEERRPINLVTMTPEERRNYNELQDLRENWLSITPPEQQSIIDSQFLAEYWGCHYSPWISDPQYPVFPNTRDINDVNCPSYPGPDNWRRYA